MKRSALLLPALALSLSAALTGCGGSDDETLTHDEFVTQANKICADGSAELEEATAAIGDAPTDEQIASFVTDTLVPNIDDQKEAIDDLSPPEDDEAAVEEMIDALGDGLDTLEDDPMAITASPGPFEAANTAATDLGLTDCAN